MSESRAVISILFLSTEILYDVLLLEKPLSVWPSTFRSFNLLSLDLGGITLILIVCVVLITVSSKVAALTSTLILVDPISLAVTVTLIVSF